MRRRASANRIALLSQVDPELRREVESLLAQDGSGGLLDRPALDAAASLLDKATVTQLTTGTELGPYRIEAPLGSGGMGEVYRAHDTRLHRTVAIKVLPRDRLAHPERKRRFLQDFCLPQL